MPKTVSAIFVEINEPQMTWTVIIDRGQPLSIKMGRGQENDLPVPQEVPDHLRSTVSRAHARLIRQGNDFWIEDLGSSNFTYVDGQVVLWPVRIAVPCDIRLGELRVHIRRTAISPEQVPDCRPARLKAAGTALPATQSLQLPWQVPLHVHSGQAGKLRLAGALVHLAEFASNHQRADDAEMHLKQLLSMFLCAERVHFLSGVLLEDVRQALIDEDVPAAGVDTLCDHIRDTLRTDTPTRVVVEKEKSIAWALQASSTESPSVTMLVGEGIQQERSSFDAEEMDIVVGMALRIAEPFLRNLRELESNRAVIPATPSCNVSGDTLQVCEKLRFWGEASSFRQAIYCAEQGAKRYLRAKQAGQKLPVVFVRGVSGTGKSKLAQLIHQLSDHNQAPLEEMNCAAIPLTLAESELFGYERGAHDMAFSAKPGIFEVAAKGTLFLDEIGKTSRDFQAKLLKVLDTGVFRRLGGKQSMETGCYVILAASEDPLELCRRGQLLEELWFRIGAFAITLPSLRERAEDIVVLISKELDSLNATLPPCERRSFSKPLMATFQSHDWPGNVRQLLQYVDVAHAMAPPGVQLIEAGHLPSHLQVELGYKEHVLPGTLERPIDINRPLDDLISKLEREYYVRLIADCAGNLSEVSRRSGKSYQTVFNKLRRLREWVEHASQPQDAEELHCLREHAGKYWPVVASVDGKPARDRDAPE